IGGRTAEDAVQPGDARRHRRRSSVGVHMAALTEIQHRATEHREGEPPGEPRVAVKSRLGRSLALPRCRAGRSGAALVELAIALPILLLLTLGSIEYGWVFLRVSPINQAARQGVRVDVRPDATADSINSNVSS